MVYLSDMLEPSIGFEPITYSLQNYCSTIELGRHIMRAGKTIALPLSYMGVSEGGQVYLRQSAESYFGELFLD